MPLRLIHQTVDLSLELSCGAAIDSGDHEKEHNHHHAEQRKKEPVTRRVRRAFSVSQRPSRIPKLIRIAIVAGANGSRYQRQAPRRRSR